MTELPVADIEEATSIIRNRINFYEQKNFELLFSKLMLGPPSQDYSEIQQLQHLFQVKEVTPNSLALSHATRLRTEKSYLNTLKICYKMYVGLNETLKKKIECLKSNYNQAVREVARIAPVTLNDVKTMEKNIQKYENDLSSMQKKYPWLKNEEYSLPNIAKEINLLVTARAQRDALRKELDKFNGLKPDLEEAKEQVAQIKFEYEDMSKKLAEAM